MTNRLVIDSTTLVFGSQVEPADFHYLPIFWLFSVFCHNWTGLKAGSRSNQSAGWSGPVRSGFLKLWFSHLLEV